MEQRLKLEQELRQRAEVLERVKGEVEELEYKLRQKEMIEHANHRSMVHSDYLPPSLLTSKPSVITSNLRWTMFRMDLTTRLFLLSF